ncbi:MAG: tetratricopeptide repeat protein [Gammaproteobacteria bacterium]
MKDRAILSIPILFGILGLSQSVFGHGIAADRLHDLTHEIGHHPKQPGLYVARGRVHLDSGHWDAALADFEKSIRIDPGYLEALYWQGEALFGKGEYAAAERVLHRYLCQVPHSPAGHRLIAQVWTQLGEPLRAAKYFDLSIRHDANPPPQVYLDRAQILMKLDPLPLKRVLTGLNAGLERHEANVALIKMLIEVDLAVGDYPQAIMDLERIPSQLRDTPLWLNRRAEIEALRGRPNEAAKLYEASLDRIGSLPKLKQQLPAYLSVRAEAERGLREHRPKGSAHPAQDSGD